MLHLRVAIKEHNYIPYYERQHHISTLDLYIYIICIAQFWYITATTVTSAAATDDDDAVYLIYDFLVTGRQYNTTKKKAISIWVPSRKGYTRTHKLHIISDDEPFGSNHHLIKEERQYRFDSIITHTTHIDWIELSLLYGKEIIAFEFEFEFNP